MMLLVITKPISSLLDSGIVPEFIESIPTIIQEVAQARPTQKLAAHWVKDEMGKLVCRWSKE